MEIKNAFITGAGTGIGRATAERLYALGWSLGLTDVNLDNLKEYTEHWDKDRVFCVKADVTKAKEIAKAVDRFCAKHQGNLRLLINNAGIMQLARFESLDLEIHKRTIDVNVTGTINTCMAAFPYLQKSTDATVINLASASSMYGIPYFSTYSASKAAVKSLTESLNIEWQDHGIRVCDMMPPFVNTTLVSGQDVKPPIIDRMGVDIVADDVATAIIKQVSPWRTHIPVSTKYSALYYFTDFVPYLFRKPVIKFLGRPKRANLDTAQRIICRLINLGPSIHKLPLEQMRSTFKVLDKALGIPKEDDVNVEELSIPAPTGSREAASQITLGARMYKPLASSGQVKSTMVYFHGGGGVIGDLDTHDNLCRKLAQESKINVIAVAYRLAPEVTFPEPVCDAIDVFNWVNQNRETLDIEDHQIGVGGDSIGGYLAAICSTASIQENLPVKTDIAPAYQFLLFPMLDFRCNSSSYAEYGSGLVLSSELIKFCRNQFLNDLSEIERPDVTLLLNEDFKDTVPTLIYTVEYDILRNDGFSYVEKLREAEVKVEHKHLEDCTHSFTSTARFSKVAQKRLKGICLELGEFIQNNR